LTTPTRFGSSDIMAKSGGRAASPPNRAGTIFVVRNGSRPLPGKVPVLDERWLKRGWIKGPPTGYGLPPFGGYRQWGKCTISVSEKEGRASPVYPFKAARRAEASRCLSRMHAQVSHGQGHAAESWLVPCQELWLTMIVTEICSSARLSFRAGKGCCGARERYCLLATGPSTS
jgi:hypothetical protein